MFSRRSLARLADTISEQFTFHLDKWEKYVGTGEVVDLQHEISKVTPPNLQRQLTAALDRFAVSRATPPLPMTGEH